jgi:hypothetical protein
MQFLEWKFVKDGLYLNKIPKIIIFYFIRLIIMDRRERALRSIQLEEPDRIPLFELSIAPSVSSKILEGTPIYGNEPLILEMRSKGIPPHEIKEKIIQDIIDLYYNKLEHDIIHCISESYSGAGLPGIFKGYSTALVFDPKIKVIRLSENMWQIGAYKFRYLSETNLLVPEPPILNTPEFVEEYIETHQNLIKEISEEELFLERSIAKKMRDKALIAAFIGDLGTFHTWEINHILRWIYTFPHIVKKFVDFEARCCIEVAKIKIDMGVDVCIVDCDWAYNHGPFIPPKLFKEIWIPALKSIVNIVHNRGGFIVCHSDGNINLLVEDMVKCGIDGIHSLQPSAGIDIGKIKEKFGDKVSLWGNIDLAYPLTFGTIEETAQETINCIKKASPGGGHILCSANSISQNVKVENYLKMMETAKKYGKYPIQYI